MRTSPKLKVAALWLVPVAVLALLTALNLWAVQDNYRFDLTASGRYSIGPQTQQVIANLREPLQVTFFYSINDQRLLDSKALLTQYAEASNLIEVRTYDPVIQPAAARRYQVRFPGTSVFESQGRRVLVNGGTEADFTNGLIQISRQAHQQICFTDGHNEYNIFSLKTHDHFEGDLAYNHSHGQGGRKIEIHERHGMGKARDALVTLGYQIKKVILLSGKDRLADCSVLVIASPKLPFTKREVSRIRRYLKNEGKVFVMLNPDIKSGLDEILAEFGIIADNNMVLDDASHYWNDPSSPAVTTYARQKITRDLPLTFFPGIRSLSPTPEKPEDVMVMPLLQSSTNIRLDSSLKTPETSLPTDGRLTLMAEAIKRLIPDNTTQSGKPRIARLVVIGDGDFATNSFFHIMGNGTLFLNTVNVLAEDEALLNIQPRGFDIPRVHLTNQQMQLTFVVSALILPLVFLLIGLRKWIKR